VRDIDAPTPARFNADPTRLYEAAGSAGKVAVLAVRLDTFERERDTRTFYFGTNEPAALTELRRRLLRSDGPLPISAEYLHRDAFDLAARYGKDIFFVISRLGTSRLAWLNRLKGRIDAIARRLPGRPDAFSDRLLQAASRLLPSHLPPRIVTFRDRFEHHLLLKVGAGGMEAARAAITGATTGGRGDFFLCTTSEAEKAFLHRFVIAGAAIRFKTLHAENVADVLSLDVALRRDERDWFERLPAVLEQAILHKVYYGHFLCHVLHQDYVLRKGADVTKVKQIMCDALDARGAEYPAEHNVGHQYRAKPALARHYRQLDPLNRFNPNIGRP